MFQRFGYRILAAATPLTVGIFITLASATGGAQSAPSLALQDEAQAADPLPNAAALVRKSLRATGELDAIAKTSARTLTGTIRLPNMEEPGTIRIVQAKPDLFLQVLTVPGSGDTQIGHDGKTTWMEHPTLGPQVLDGIVAAQERIRNAYDFGLHTRKHLKSMETVARKTFDGRDCYEVRCELSSFVVNGAVLDLEATARYRTFTEYYDVATGLLAGADVMEATPLGDKSSTTIYRDYKELAPAVLVATQLVTRVDGVEIAITIGSLDFEPVEAASFKPPAAVQALLDEAARAEADDGAAPGEDGTSGDSGGEGDGADGRAGANAGSR